MQHDTHFTGGYDTWYYWVLSIPELAEENRPWKKSITRFPIILKISEL